MKDPSPDAYEKVVDRLLASEQHGVRYGRHWLDVLRYADADERMNAAPGIHLWRDWVINALNRDLPYDQFVRTQLTGYRTTERTQMSATGLRSRVEPRPDDMFALGFLARGAVVRDNKDTQELPIVAVETVSTAFMGLTVGCAKCHDHMYDPISQRDFYAMKALFDPLVVKKVTLATPAEIMARGKALDESQEKRLAIEEPLNALAAPYKTRLYDDRVAMLPADVQVVIRKPEKERTVQEQKIADDYFPILRIDADKIKEVMPEEVRKKYHELQKQLNQMGGGFRGRRGGELAGLLDRGGRPETGAGEELHPDQRRSRAARERQGGAARLAVRTRQDRFPRRPDRSVFRLADGAGKPAVCPRGGQSSLAMAFWRRLAQNAQRLRKAGRNPGKSRVARLAGVRVRRSQIQHEGDAPPDGHFGDLQAGVGGGSRPRDRQHQASIRRILISGASACSASKPSRSGIRSYRSRQSRPFGGRPVLRHRLRRNASTSRRRWAARRVGSRSGKPIGAALT